MRNWTYLAVAAGALALGVASSHAALITFSGLDGNPQGNPVPNTYQPLLNTYSGTSSGGNFAPTPLPYTDGANIGVTVAWDGTSSTSQRVQNGGVTDHTNDGSGTVWYDNGSGTMSIIFSKPVYIPSLYYANYNGGTYPIEFQGYTNSGDATPAVDTGTITYNQPSGYTWIQLTALAGTPIEKLVITGSPFKQIDDITVNLAPEPASLGLLGLATLGFLRRRRA